MEKIRFRFPPSPTGFLHIGSLRTVLFNYLAAKNLNGKLILRIEDTDQKREIPGATRQLIDILGWLDIKFDEGPEEIGGDYGPYLQSQRLDIYKTYQDALLKNGGAYLCFCSPERLTEMRLKQQGEKLPPRYDRKCRDLSEKEINKKMKRNEPYVIRQKLPLKGEVVVHDELRGKIVFRAEDLEDHILIKSNSMPTYQFACVVDDHLMEISHVLRGEEWISSFPKNILLYESFGWKPPKFFHLPLVLDKKGGKLSKRKGDVAVENFKKNGYLPEALINFCALLGWHPDDDNEILSTEQLIKNFKLKNIGTSPAVFDAEKLDYLNGYYIRHTKIKELVKLCMPYLKDNLQKTENTCLPARQGKQKTDFIRKVIFLEQERMKKLSEIGELTKFFFIKELNYPAEMLIWKKMEKTLVKKNLEKINELLEKIPENSWTKNSIEEEMLSYLRAKKLKVGEYLWPMRVALTGEKASPGPFEVAEILGKNESLKRILDAIEK